ncbi:hypothetical protein F5887DRAFT_878633 [Amanita rubescens]|nr:hypothetical protein F5887DRAFT_878633 [Amanita rubescens]
MFPLFSALRECFPPTSQFSVDDVPDLTGKTILITGANTGIGKETVKVLLSRNAKVYIAGRGGEKTERAIANLKDITGREAHFIQCDLADLHSIKAAAQEFTTKERELHILINNAGVAFSPIDLITAQGYDMQLGTNALGHFYLTQLLLPTLLSTVKSSSNKVRVVTVSSLAHQLGGIDFNTFRDSPARKKLGPFFLYMQSKFANMVFTAELARKYGDQGIVATAVNPGNIETELNRNQNPVTVWLGHRFCYSVSFGVLGHLYAATSPEAENLNGKYIVPWARVGSAKESALDPQLGHEFWNWCEEQVKDI